jgi:hypothetical protein
MEDAHNCIKVKKLICIDVTEDAGSLITETETQTGHEIDRYFVDSGGKQYKVVCEILTPFNVGDTLTYRLIKV